MENWNFMTQLFARDPRKLVRYPDLPLDAALAELRKIEEQLGQDGPRKNPSESVEASAANQTEVLGASLAGLATHVWRTRGKLIDPATSEPREETRRALRHVEASLESLTAMGVTMNDWVGQPYDPGLPVKVITFDPTPGMIRDTVVEAVRPTVIWRDQLLQLGEVIVGIPPHSSTPK